MTDFAASRAGRAIDFVEDPAHPALVKVAQEHHDLRGGIPDADDARFIPDQQFAYVGMEKGAKVRFFPTNSPAATVASLECFRTSQDVFTKTAQKKIAAEFMTACEWHGTTLPEPMRAFLDQMQFPGGASFNGQIKEASDTPYALMLEHPDGEVARFYALPDHGAVKTAAAYFEEWHRELAPEHRPTFARAVEKRASELGVHDLDRGPALRKYASGTFGPGWTEALEYRVRRLGPDHRATASYEKLAGAIASGRANIDEAARFMGEVDKLAGLQRPDPWGELAAGNEKVASGFSEEVDGEMVTDQMLDKLISSGDVEKLYGQSFAREFGKRPVEVFSSLPLDDKRVLKEALYGRA